MSELDFVKLEKRFDETIDKEKEIVQTLVDIEADIVDVRFNPDTIALSKMHDIMDDFQSIQTRLGKLKKKALSQNLNCKLYFKDIEVAYNNKRDQLMRDYTANKPADKKTLKAEIDANINESLKKDNIDEYLVRAEKKEWKSKTFLAQIDTFIDVMKEMDDKCSRKISLMALQKDLGVLVAIKIGDKRV